MPRVDCDGLLSAHSANLVVRDSRLYSLVEKNHFGEAVMCRLACCAGSGGGDGGATAAVPPLSAACIVYSARNRPRQRPLRRPHTGTARYYESSTSPTRGKLRCCCCCCCVYAVTVRNYRTAVLDEHRDVRAIFTSLAARGWL